MARKRSKKKSKKRLAKSKPVKTTKPSSQNTPTAKTQAEKTAPANTAPKEKTTPKKPSPISLETPSSQSTPPKEILEKPLSIDNSSLSQTISRVSKKNPPSEKPPTPSPVEITPSSLPSPPKSVSKTTTQAPRTAALSWFSIVWLSLCALTMVGDASWFVFSDDTYGSSLPTTEELQTQDFGSLIISGRVISADGTPVFSAEVFATNTDDPSKKNTVTRLVLSDADGKFSLQNLPEGKFTLFARTSLGLRSEEIVQDAPASNVTLVLPEGDSIFGKAYDETTLEPVPFARIRLGGSGLWPPQETIADQFGFFSFSGVPTGVYTLAATGAQANGTPLASPILEGLRVEDEPLQTSVDLALKPAWVLRGALVTERGDAITGAQVLLSEDPFFVSPRRVFTDEIGVFSVEGVLSGQMYLRVLPEDGPHTGPIRVPIAPILRDPDFFLPSPEDPDAVYLSNFSAKAGFTQLSPPEESVFALEVWLPEGQTITGKVIDDNGNPVDGALVLLYDPKTGEILGDPGPRRGRLRWEQEHFGVGASSGDPSSFRSNSDGSFAIVGIREGSVLAVAFPRQSNLAPASTECGEGKTCQLITKPANEIAGRVVDANGFPIEAAVLRALPQGGKSVIFSESDTRGEFLLSPVGTLTDIRVRAKGYGPKWIRGVKPGETELEIVLEVHDSFLEGRIVDKKGFPIPAAKILAAVEDFRFQTSSEEDGGFLIEKLPKGEVALSVSKEGYAPKEVKCPEKEDCQVTLQEGGRIVGQVLDENNDLIPFVQIEIEAAHVNVGTFSSEGNFIIGELPPGKANLQVTASGYVPLTYPVTIREGEEETLSLTLQKAGSLRGKVLLEDGAVASNANIVLTNPESQSIRMQTRKDGSFVIAALLPGTWKLLAKKEKQAIEKDDIEIEEGKSTSIQISLETNKDIVLPSTKGEALGLHFIKKNGLFLITKVNANSPADDAKLRIGDTIEEIDAISTSQMSISEALQRLNGKSIVTLAIRAEEGGELLEAKLFAEETP